MEAAIDLRHTYLGAFNPTQNVTQKLKTSLEKVRIANCYLNLAKSIIVTWYSFFLFQRFPDNVHELANGTLHISSTDVYSGQNILIDNFQNKAEVIDVGVFF